MARILLGVSGGIAAYKALELVRLATAAGHAVRAIQTPASMRFVGSASFAALTGAPVLHDELERDPARGAFPGQVPPDHDPLSHLELVRNADVFMIAPASANTIAKLAAGLADNLLTSAALAAACPLLVAPAMNDHMWQHAATQANVITLRARGVTVLEPGVGRLGSDGEWGAGRLPEPAELLGAAEMLASGDPSTASPAPVGAGEAGQQASSDLAGVRVLVTAGGTREPIDAVRFLGNRSSGRMGFALGGAAAGLGASVTVVAANVALGRDPRVHYVDVQTAAEMKLACERSFAKADVLLMAAAVADFRPVARLEGKFQKGAEQKLELALERTPDILAELASSRRAGQTLIGFAAEHGAGGLARARAKLARKGLDAVIVNDISRTEIGFESTDNEVTIITPAGETHVARASKEQIARAVIGSILELRAAAPAQRSEPPA